jgi:hypothetical protein
MNDHKQRMEEAIREALGSASGELLSIARRYVPEIKDNGLATCPYCQKRGKYQVKKTIAGHWCHGCYRESCEGSFASLKSRSMGDTIGFIAEHEGCDRKRALEILFEITGVTHPRDRRDEQ